MITLSLEELQDICINIWDCSAEGDNGEYSSYSDRDKKDEIKERVLEELDRIGKKDE